MALSSWRIKQHGMAAAYVVVMKIGKKNGVMAKKRRHAWRGGQQRNSEHQRAYKIIAAKITASKSRRHIKHQHIMASNANEQ